MVLYHAHLAHGARRYVPGDLHDHSQSTKGIIPAPSKGLTIEELVTGLAQLGQQASFELFEWTERTNDPSRQVKRRVDSNFPTISILTDHSFLTVGYMFDADTDTSTRDVVVHDPARGPYLRYDPSNATSVEDYIAGEVLSLASPISMDGSQADLLGRLALSNMVASEGMSEDTPGDPTDFRAYVIASDDLKSQASFRLPVSAANVYRLLPMPAYVWVVEALVRGAFAAGRSVIGEAIVDATASGRPSADQVLEEAVIATHLRGRIAVRVGHGQRRDVSHNEGIAGFQPYQSGAPVGPPPGVASSQR